MHILLTVGTTSYEKLGSISIQSSIEVSSHSERAGEGLSTQGRIANQVSSEPEVLLNLCMK